MRRVFSVSTSLRPYPLHVILFSDEEVLFQGQSVWTPPLAQAAANGKASPVVFDTVLSWVSTSPEPMTVLHDNTVGSMMLT